MTNITKAQRELLQRVAGAEGCTGWNPGGTYQRR
jgi:hypothetical protein